MTGSVAASPPAGEGHGQIPGLTGLRGIAALLVVLSHLVGISLFAQYPMFLGELGVMVFFSLSGFLMALIYSRRSFDRDAAVGYAIARFARIAPAYLFVIVTAYAIRNAVDPDFAYQITNQNVVRHLLFSGNAAVFWSIPPEVQFYALFLLLWMAYATATRSGRWWPLAAAAVVCVVLIAERRHFPGTIVASKLHFFLFGALAGHLRAGRATRAPSQVALTVAQLAVVLVLIALGVDAIRLGFVSNEDVYGSLGNALAAAFVVYVFSYGTALSRALLANPPLALCGTCSFSIYLLHDPVIYWMRPLAATLGATGFTVAVVVAVVALSYASYRLVEMPGGRLCRAALRGLATRMPGRVKALSRR